MTLPDWAFQESPRISAGRQINDIPHLRVNSFHPGSQFVKPRRLPGEWTYVTKHHKKRISIPSQTIILSSPKGCHRADHIEAPKEARYPCPLKPELGYNELSFQWKHTEISNEQNTCLFFSMHQCLINIYYCSRCPLPLTTVLKFAKSLDPSGPDRSQPWESYTLASQEVTGLKHHQWRAVAPEYIDKNSVKYNEVSHTDTFSSLQDHSFTTYWCSV